MSKQLNADGRAVLVLQQEAKRMADAAERVRLVVQAMALRHGIPSISPREPENVRSID